MLRVCVFLPFLFTHVAVFLRLRGLCFHALVQEKLRLNLWPLLYGRRWVEWTHFCRGASWSLFTPSPLALSTSSSVSVRQQAWSTAHYQLLLPPDQPHKKAGNGIGNFQWVPRFLNTHTHTRARIERAHIWWPECEAWTCLVYSHID